MKHRFARHFRRRGRLCAVVFFALMFTGCAGQKEETLPPPPPPPALPPAAKAPTPRTPPRPAPVIHAPQSTPKPPEPETPLLLSPAIADERKDKIESEVTTKIRHTEQLVATVDLRHLTSQESETFTAIQSFLSKAKEALHEKDMPRALNLAEKAEALVQDLPNSTGK